MTRFNTIAFLFLTIPYSPTTYGQGRVDNDPILHNIWWTTRKIDRDTSLKHFVHQNINLTMTSLGIYYSKADNLCKVISLSKTQSGTEMTTFYFTNQKPIFISVERNNFLLSSDSTQVFKAVNSFKEEGDTSLHYKPLYLKQYQAEYYFYNDKVQFAAVVIYSNKGLVKDVQHDNKNDIYEGMKLFDKSKQYLPN